MFSIVVYFRPLRILTRSGPKYCESPEQGKVSHYVWSLTQALPAGFDLAVKSVTFLFVFKRKNVTGWINCNSVTVYKTFKVWGGGVEKVISRTSRFSHVLNAWKHDCHRYFVHLHLSLAFIYIHLHTLNIYSRAKWIFIPLMKTR